MTEVTNEALAAAHALATAVAYRADDQLVSELLREARNAGEGLEVALGACHVTLRHALDCAEREIPGFRARFLRNVGAAWTSADT